MMLVQLFEFFMRHIKYAFALVCVLLTDHFYHDKVKTTNVFSLKSVFREGIKNKADANPLYLRKRMGKIGQSESLDNARAENSANITRAGIQTSGIVKRKSPGLARKLISQVKKMSKQLNIFQSDKEVNPYLERKLAEESARMAAILPKEVYQTARRSFIKKYDYEPDEGELFLYIAEYLNIEDEKELSRMMKAFIKKGDEYRESMIEDNNTKV